MRAPPAGRADTVLGVFGRNRTDKHVEGWTDEQTDLPRGIGFHLQAGDPGELVVRAVWREGLGAEALMF